MIAPPGVAGFAGYLSFLGAMFAIPSAIFLALALGGCATTRITVKTSDGVVVSIALPKNMDADHLKVKAGVYELSADRLTTDASGVIHAKNEAVKDVAGAVGKVAPLLLVP